VFASYQSLLKEIFRYLILKQMHQNQVLQQF